MYNKAVAWIFNRQQMKRQDAQIQHVLTTCNKHTCLTVTTQGEGVATFPVGTTTSTDGLVESMALSDTSVLLSDSSQSTCFSSLVHSGTDPVDAWVSRDCFVVWVHENNFKVLVRRILVDPIRVQHAQIETSTGNSFFSSRTQRTLVFELIDSLRSWLSVHLSFGHWSLSSTTSHTDTINHKSLLSLVT